MKLKIHKTDDPVLRASTKEVTVFDFELEQLVNNMIETMRGNNGVGLAAPQIGISKKILVCEFAGDEDAKIPGFPLTVICNPTITKESKSTRKMVEGCLSFPGLEILIERPSEITVEGLDRYGKPIKIEASNIFARVLQHENDHLNGTLLIDHLREIDTVFIGTGSLGAPALEALAMDAQYNVKLVITGDSTATSRHPEKNLIEETAKKYNLPTCKTKNINSDDIIAKIKKVKPEIGVMADFGQIIKQDILDLFPNGLINIHPSLLPKHRGPSPIQQTILDGDKTTGVTLILTGAKMDAGAIISKVEVELSSSETASILKDYLARIGATLLLNSIPYYLSGDLTAQQQDESKATYNHLFKKEDGIVSPETEAVEVERKIRAFNVWPKVSIQKNSKQIQLLSAHFDQEGTLIIDRVKPEGKKEMTYDEFRRGYRVELTWRQ